MKNAKITTKDANLIYDKFQDYKLGKKAEKYLQEKKVPKHQFETFCKLSRKIGKEEFVSLLVTGEVPTVKLSNKEMELIKGGLLPFLVIVALHIIIEVSTMDKLH